MIIDQIKDFRRVAYGARAREILGRMVEDGCYYRENG